MAEIKKTTDKSQITPISKEPQKNLSFEERIIEIVTAISEDRREVIKNKIFNFISQEMNNYKSIFEKYHVMIQFDDTTMKRIDADNIYNSLKKIPADSKKDILLVLYSFGGDIASAYLISKLCREYTNDRVIVAVPRLAKSAATLICCGADEIHMGSLSELGPIDPQFNHLPALGLKNTIKQIAETVTLFPQSNQLFADYLAKTIKPIDLGYYDRIVESASQYAQRLLSKRCKKLQGSQIKKIADHLVYDYSDHGFVIDKGEAEDIFGKDVIKINSDEYNFSDSIYSLFSLIANICQPQYKFYYIGSCDLSDSVGLIPRQQ